MILKLLNIWSKGEHQVIKKKSIEEIIKVAQLGGYQSALQNKPTPKNPGIINMQQALVDLFKSVSSNDAFGNFMVKNYLKDANSMSLPGDFKVDGAWGPKTTTALKNTAAVAEPLLKLASDFKIDVKGWDQKDLADFKKGIPNNDKDITLLQKIDWAPAMAAHIRSIVQIYNQVKSEVVEKHGDSIGEGAAYDTVKKKDPMAGRLTNEQIQGIIQRFQGHQIPIQGPQIPGSNKPNTQSIDLSQLTDLGKLTAFQQNAMPDVSVKEILGQIRQHFANLQISDMRPPAQPK